MVVITFGLWFFETDILVRNWNERLAPFLYPFLERIYPCWKISGNDGVRKWGSFEVCHEVEMYVFKILN